MAGRDTDTNPNRGYERFCVTPNIISKQDRNNPHVLKSILYEDKLTLITRRLCLPTISSINRSEVIFPVQRGHDVNALEVWHNMPLYDNHFLKNMHDKFGSLRFRYNSRGPVPGLSQYPARIPSQLSREVNHHVSSHPDRLSYRQQWLANQKHQMNDFKQPAKWRR